MKSKLLPTVTAALFLLVAANATADLCPKCRDGIYISSVGKCVVCKGHTTSGAFKLCRACSAKLAECEHCRARLNPAAKPPERQLAVQESL